LLNISIVDTNFQRQLVLEGTLVDPGVAELKVAWMIASEELAGREFVINIGNLLVVSKEGQRELLDLISDRLGLRCNQVLTRYVV
jgi:hypothetical protein